MAISDILKNLSAGGGDQSAPAIGLPGFDAGSAKALKAMQKEIKAINKLVKDGKGDWKAYANTGPLLKAIGASKKLKKAQSDLNKVLASGKGKLGETAAAYRNLTKAQKASFEANKDANREMNETKGIAGRTKNVLDEMFDVVSPGAALFGAALRDLNIVAKDMGQNFTMLASRGQLANQTVGELAKNTALYSLEMKLSSVQAAAMGITAEESNAAFSKLTSVYGGSAAAVQDVSKSWSELTILSTTTGVGLESVADLAAQGYRRLGESLETTKDTVAAVGAATKEMNDRFGAAAPTADQLSKAVTNLAYSQGFYNQNTRMVVETLSREVSMQLALGRSRDAAVAKASANLEMMGKINIKGVLDFRNKIQADFNATKNDAAARLAFLKSLGEQFGSEGEMIAGMLERGTLSSSQNITYMQKIFKNSSAMQQEMLEKFRAQAAEDGPGALNAMLGVGISLADASEIIEEAGNMALLITKMQAGGEAGSAAEKRLIGEDKGPEATAFRNAVLADKPRSTSDLAKMHRAMGGSDDSTKKPGEKPGDKAKDYIATQQGKGWFLGATNSFNTIKGLLATLPMSLGAVIAGLILKKRLGSSLGNLPTSAGFKRPTMGGMARGAGKMAKGGLAVAAGLAITTMAIDAFAAMGKATEMFGKDATVKDAFGVWAGTTLNHLSMGMFGSFTDDELKALARGSLETPLTTFGSKLGEWMGDTMMAWKEGGMMGLIRSLTGTEKSQEQKAFEQAKEAGYSGTSGTMEEYHAHVARKTAEREAAAATPSTGGVPPGQAPPGRGGAMVGTQTGEEVDAQGNLTATVTFSRDVQAAADSAIQETSSPV